GSKIRIADFSPFRLYRKKNCDKLWLNQDQKKYIMNVITFILAGGQGKRLRPLTFAIPKPLLPIKEKPIVEVMLQKLKNYNLTDIIFSLGYKGFLIENYFRNGRTFGLNIRYSYEEETLGTCGPLTLIKDLVNSEDVILVINGDIITNLNFTKFINAFKTQEHDLMIGVKSYKHKVPFGVIDLKDNQFNGIIEKPEKKVLISTGIYLLKAGLLPRIPTGRKYDMTDLISDLHREGKSIGVYKIKEMWKGIENLDDLNYIRKRT
ncbi:MAG: NTP transferase domain-containing protein, partial [Candidatus Aminicenantes bacterium]|nr:NTP transferase domain-containing protein [Candidatus Aminicenantes bacterium]